MPTRPRGQEPSKKPRRAGEATPSAWLAVALQWAEHAWSLQWSAPWGWSLEGPGRWGGPSDQAGEQRPPQSPSGPTAGQSRPSHPSSARPFSSLMSRQAGGSRQNKTKQKTFPISVFP